jgi:hypothetical protein
MLIPNHPLDRASFPRSNQPAGSSLSRINHNIDIAQQFADRLITHFRIRPRVLPFEAKAWEHMTYEREIEATFCKDRVAFVWIKPNPFEFSPNQAKWARRGNGAILAPAYLAKR